VIPRIDFQPAGERGGRCFLGGSAAECTFVTAESARAFNIRPLGPETGGSAANHTDVVPVERQYWDVDPFGGELRDGFLYGRGALDMKGMGVIELMAFLLLKRQGVALRRGVAFVAMADEEAGSDHGATWLAENRPDWLTSELVINEGAYGLGRPTGKENPVFRLPPARNSHSG
jgi:hypothetical protein